MLDIEVLSAQLRNAGDAAKKAWWERYLKGAISFYGVPMATIRTAVRDWSDGAAPADLRAAAFAFLRRPVAEEKLAGILVMQELLLPSGELVADRDLPPIAACFDAGDIADWNTTDWLCVRVLGPLIERDGKPVAEEIAGWVEAPSMWRRRSAAVAFVPVAARGDEVFRGLVDMVTLVCEQLVVESERFIQTGIGWSLRELSDAAPDRVFAFLSTYRDTMSREALRMGAARLSDQRREAFGITGKRRRR